MAHPTTPTPEVWTSCHRNSKQVKHWQVAGSAAKPAPAADSSSGGGGKRGAPRRSLLPAAQPTTSNSCHTLLCCKTVVPALESIPFQY